MTPAILLALAAALSTPSPSAASQPDTSANAPAVDAPATTAALAATDPSAAPTTSADTSVPPEDRIPAGAPKDDYGFVAWCHGALAGQLELDPVVEKDMDAIEGKAKAKERHVGDAIIAKERRGYLKEYERALSAAEKASPTAIHQHGVDSELKGYGIWAATRNKQKVWRMVDWGNWEVPKRCGVVAKRLYDRSSLFGEALTTSAAADTARSGGATSDTTSIDPAKMNGAPAAQQAAGAGPATDAAPTTTDTPPPAQEPHPDPVADGLKGPH